MRLKRLKHRGIWFMEMLFITPLMLVLIIGLTNVAAYTNASSEAHNAAAATARYYSNHPSASASELKTYALNALPNSASAYVSVSSLATTQDNFTMRVYTNQGLKTANARSTTNPKRITVTINVPLVLIQSIIPLPSWITQVSQSATGAVSTTDAAA